MTPAEKLNKIADAMQPAIDAKFADRLTNTPKRQRQNGEARNEGHRLRRTQSALRALASHHEAGTIPEVLKGVTSKKQVYELMRTVMDYSGGYYDPGRDTGEPALNTPEARALWALVNPNEFAHRQAEELRRRVEKLQFMSIPGYFPTPAEVVLQMIDEADIPEEECTILEPSAGSGAILDALRDKFPLAELHAFEVHATLGDILAAKGYELDGCDFLDAEPAATFDRVIMNPPFEGLQDIDHVRHAFTMLKPGGRLVAIMSPGPFFRTDRKASDFREWFEDNGGEKRELPPNSFRESGTGVNTVIVTLDKVESPDWLNHNDEPAAVMSGAVQGELW